MSVDGTEYGRIVAPDGGFQVEASNFQSTAGEAWKDGSPMAPFDQEVCVIYERLKRDLVS